MLARRYIGAIVTGYFALSAISTWAANPVAWQVALSTTGNDVFWTSPTSLTTGFPEYDWSYEITEATANILLLGDQDLLPSLEVTSGSGTASTLPVVVVDSLLSESTTGSSAQIRIEVDSTGTGHASGTDITLGTVLGLPIRRVDLKVEINVLGVPTGDFDRNGTVSSADYELWKNSIGSTVDLAADGNRNGVVDAADYTLWRDGIANGGLGVATSTTVPEPASAEIAVLCLGGWGGRRRRRIREKIAIS
jgi:hypothetical protein